MGLGCVFGGGLADRAAHDPQRGDERDVVGVGDVVISGVPHQRADRVMATKVTPDLLLDELGRFRSKDRARTSLVSFQLIESVLDLPTLTISERELLGGKDPRIKY